MVSSVTSLTGNGLKDWIIQRATAIYLSAYSILFAAIWLGCSPWTYSQWTALFHTAWFQLATAVALFAILFHAWIGIWTVTTDYIKSTVLRLMVQGLVLFVLLSQLIAGFMIIWGQ
ncbi:MAG: succinate dehydrogenase, hydrophobic membrane anchor protein [Gammaproteobacteria bacterium]|nr:succinate dehydrogenase, hydrophobic membrane anchor protein [Gammaproteobacteria bacterium]MCH9716207.1 succinate dehydrogenase, hydrophobic membrane anchor protein [Gammaproteobacteria bacterium]MCH9764221.1 succinate dehydrogenase, hydrophobic membrane anchor protein [Gammaproteobacteria bacterium]